MCTFCSRFEGVMVNIQLHNVGDSPQIVQLDIKL